MAMEALVVLAALLEPDPSNDLADAGECESNPRAVIKECPESCGVCTAACHDHDEGCKGWAFAKLCAEEPAFMFRVCPSTCGICQILESSDKDEL